MYDYTFHELDTSLYYLSESARKPWNELSEHAKMALEHAFRAKGRPFPWNEELEDPGYIASLGQVEPDDLVDACSALGKNISLSDWLRIHDLRLGWEQWPRYDRTIIAVVEAASRVLMPDTLVTFGSIARLPAGFFAATNHSPNRHVLIRNPEIKYRFPSVCSDECGPQPEQLSSSSVKGAGIGADLIIGNSMPASLKWYAQPAMSGDLYTGGWATNNQCRESTHLVHEVIRLMSECLNPVVQSASSEAESQSVSDSPGFIICPADRNLFASQRLLDLLAAENLSIVAMLTCGESIVVLRRGSGEIIQSIVLESADDPKIEEFLRYVFGKSDTAPVGSIATPSNRFLSPEATHAAEQFRKRAERTKLPLVQPGGAGTSPLGVDVLYALWRSICLETEERDSRELDELKPAPQLETADPEIQNLYRYLDGWFRSSLGRTYGGILEMSCNLGLGELVSKNLIEVMWPADRLPPIPLPAEADRDRLLALQGRIFMLEAEAATLREDTWAKPLLLKEHELKFTCLNTPEEDSSWIDDIPFPIANIVWQVHTSARAKDRLDLLLKLFEGLASFHASILISVAVGQPSVCGDLRTILPELKEKGCDIRRATFGTWVQIYDRLAKLYRSMIASSTGSIPAFACFGSSAKEYSEVLGKLASKETSTILQRANHLRNRVSGHGPVITEALAANHEVELQDLMSAWRKAVGSVWQDLRLIQATDQMSRKSGTFHLHVRVLAGVRQPFPLESVSLTEAPDSDWLHLHQVGSTKTLALLPFIRISDPPAGAQAACYFFNRKESDGAHFVSYHFGENPEKTFPNDPTDILLAMLG